MPTPREEDVANHKLEDMTFEAWLFLLAKELSYQSGGATDGDTYLTAHGKYSWKHYYDDGWTPEECAREELSYMENE